MLASKLSVGLIGVNTRYAFREAVEFVVAFCRPRPKVVFHLAEVLARWLNLYA